MTVAKYLDSLNKRFKTGISTEHTYRGDLQNLLESLAPDLAVTNEATRIQCGAPDYILTKDDIPIGYIEAKDIGIDLKSKLFHEQFDRYKASLDNLIITNYLDFHLYVDGEFATSVSIGQRERKINYSRHRKYPVLRKPYSGFLFVSRANNHRIKTACRNDGRESKNAIRCHRECLVGR